MKDIESFVIANDRIAQHCQRDGETNRVENRLADVIIKAREEEKRAESKEQRRLVFEFHALL